MKKRLFLIITVLMLLLASSINTVLAESPAPAETKKTEVVILGTIHGAHKKSPTYPQEVLKAILLELKPDAILNELPLSQVDADGRPIYRSYRNPEGWAADTAATELGIRQIPFDRPYREENFKKTNYFERQKKFFERMRQWRYEVEEKDPTSCDLKMMMLFNDACRSRTHLGMKGTPHIINSEARDSMIRIKHALTEDIFPLLLEKYPEYKSLIEECNFFRDEWRERNEIMIQNILKATSQYPGKRLVVVTGATHRYILRDLLIKDGSVDVKEYWEVIDFNLYACLKSINKDTKIETSKKP